MRHSKQTIRAKKKKKISKGTFQRVFFSPQVNFNLSTKLNICAGDINDIRFNRERSYPVVFVRRNGILCWPLMDGVLGYWTREERKEREQRGGEHEVQ